MLRSSPSAQAVFFLAVVAGNPAYANPVGLWYSIGQPHDPEIVTKDQFNADGSFLFEHRKYVGCELVYRAVEEGLWNQEGDIVTTHTRAVNGEPISYTHRFRYEAKNESEMHLYHLESDYLYIERAGESFQSRECWAGV